MVIAQQLPQTSRRRHKGHLDRGAAAVEMALVLPVLLFLLMGMIDFGRMFNAQIQLSQAAREGVRLAALNTTGVTTGPVADNPYGDAAIVTRVSSAAGGLPPFSVDSVGCLATPNDLASYACITYCPTTVLASDPTTVLASDNATVVVKTNFTSLTGITAFPKIFGLGSVSMPTILQSTGVMRCTG